MRVKPCAVYFLNYGIHLNYTKVSGQINDLIQVIRNLNFLNKW
jgi:hypothetical protein